MIDAGLIAQTTIQRQEHAAENTMRIARVGLLAPKSRELTEQQAEAAAKDFEALFISQMLSQMFGESLGEEFFGSKETTEVYRSMMVEQYGKQITAAGGIGVADYVKTELLKLQEVQP